MDLLTPAWRKLSKQALQRCASAHSQRVYQEALAAFIAWCRANQEPRFTDSAVLGYRQFLIKQKQLAPNSVNQHLKPLRLLAKQGVKASVLSAEDAAQILDVPRLKEHGVRTGNWLTHKLSKRMLAGPDRQTLIGKRDYLVLMLIFNCGLRRAEVANLDLNIVQKRQGRWTLANLRGKGRRIRTIPLPAPAKSAMDDWIDASGIRSGRLLRGVNKGGTLAGTAVKENTIWRIVRAHALKALGRSVAPHDLRRTFGRLAYEISHDLLEIQQLYGHSSVMTTERYLSLDQNLVDPVNDRLNLS